MVYEEDFVYIDGSYHDLFTRRVQRAAEYLINLANLKGHSYGITLCGKNHFGSFLNGNAMRSPEGANLHQFLTRNEMGIYSPLTDLMANEQLGGKPWCP